MTKRPGTIMGVVLWGGLAMGSTTATAQTVYKCHDARGQAVYQATPCAHGTTQAWRREMEVPPTAAAPPPAVAPRTATSAPRRATARAAGKRSEAQGAVISLHRDAEGCGRTKAQRDRALARRGLKRTFMELRRWDERVQDACR